MLDDATLHELVSNSIFEDLPGSEILSISTKGDVDKDGNEILRISITLSDASARSLTGDQFVDLVLGLRAVLSYMGEERFPVIDYATEADLLDDAA